MKRYLKLFETYNDYLVFINSRDSADTNPIVAFAKDMPNQPQFSKSEVHYKNVLEAPENDVNFYDYDGFRLASCTIEEAKNLTSLPTTPPHEGLVFEEWNWTLDDIKTYDRQYIDVGANYVTEDGKTHIKIVSKAGETLTITFHLYGQNTLTLSWGDGSENSSASTVGGGAQTFTFNHTYRNEGRYDIVCDGTGFSLTNTNATVSSNHMIVEINAGNNASFGQNYALSNTSIKLSISKTTNGSFIRGFMYSSVPQINIPRANHNISGYYPFQNLKGRISFPKQIGALSSMGAFMAVITNRLVIPKCVSGSTIASGSFSNMVYTDVFSLPQDFQFGTLASGAFFSGCGNLKYIDIVPGWVPAQSMVLNAGSCWSRDSLVKFLTNLGTTENAITLTFGATNLGRLSDDDKAIATNKGYTLA